MVPAAQRDELRWQYFDAAYQHASPDAAQLAEDLSRSLPLLEKIRQRKRRVTDDTLHGAWLGLDTMARLLIHDARVLRALIEVDAIDSIDVVCSPWGKVLIDSQGAGKLFGPDRTELVGANLGELFQSPPHLIDSDEVHRVVAHYLSPTTRGGVRFGSAVVSAAHSPIGKCDWFVTVLFRESDDKS